MWRQVHDMTAAPPRLLTVAARWDRARRAIVATMVLLAAALVDPERPLPIGVCLWKWATGRPCPTCGLTRAVCHAMRGEWATSLDFHPAGVLVVAGFAGWAVWSALEARRGLPLLETARSRSGSALLRLGVVVSLVSWIVRLLSGTSV